MTNILTNSAALKSLYHLQRNEGRATEATERLASGKRLNKAGDDAAGAAIVNRMPSQINGGVSGKPLLNKSNKIIKEIKNYVGDKIKIIGTGGITSSESAMSKLNSGADLLQMYTGLVYKGSSLIKDITSGLK